MIHAQGSEIFANRLQRAAEYCGNPHGHSVHRSCSHVRRARRGNRPQVQKGLNAGGRLGARGCVRYERHRCLVQVLPEPFVVAE